MSLAFIPGPDTTLMDRWRFRAACRDTPRDVFFPEHVNKGTLAAARAVCTPCEVREECLAWAIKAGETGIWAGTSDTQRRTMRPARYNRCAWCGVTFEAPKNESCCSPVHRMLHVRRYNRDYQRDNCADRVTGERFDAGHGTISRYQSGCTCSACRAVAREKQNMRRTASA